MNENGEIGSARIATWFFLGALLIGAFFRLIYLSADPPWDFTWSQALYTDGARVIDGARNKIMFGSWIVDTRSPTILFYPIMNLLAYIVFLIAGVGLAQANLCGSIFAILSIALIYLCMKKIAGKWAGAISAIMLAFNYSHMVYSRVPMVESLEVFVLILIFYLFISGKRQILLVGFLLGIAALMVKLHTIHLLVAFVIYLLLEKRWTQEESVPSRPWRDILTLILGLVASFVFWFVLIYRVDPSVIAKYFKSNVLIAQQSSWEVGSLTDFLTIRVGSLTEVGSGKDGFFTNCGIVSLLCYLGLLSLFSCLSNRKAKPWEVFALIWFVVAAISLAMLAYRPHRYFMILLPSTILVATSFLNRIAEGQPIFSASKPRWFKIAFIVWFVWVAIHIEMDLLYRIIPWEDENVFDSALFKHYVSVWRKILIFLSAGIGFLLVLGKRIETLKWDWGLGARKVILFSLLVAIAAQGSYSFLRYATKRSYSLLYAAHSLKRILGENVFLVGECATTLALETDFRTLPAYGDLIRHGEKDKFEAYPITHFLLRSQNLTDYLLKNYEDFEKRIIPIRFLVVGGLESLVVRDPKWPGYEKSNYVPSGFEVAIAKGAEGDLEGAIKDLEDFLGKHPDSYEAIAAIALYQAALGDLDEALETMERAIEVCDHEESYLYEGKGDILELMGRRQEALQFWRKAYRLNPTSEILREKIVKREG